MVTTYFNVLSQHWLHYAATYPQKSIMTPELCFITALSNMNVAPKAMSPNFVKISLANTQINIMYYYYFWILLILIMRIFINSHYIKAILYFH
jgi:hypothetical protein